MLALVLSFPAHSRQICVFFVLNKKKLSDSNERSALTIDLFDMSPTIACLCVTTCAREKKTLILSNSNIKPYGMKSSNKQLSERAANELKLSNLCAVALCQSNARTFDVTLMQVPTRFFHLKKYVASVQVQRIFAWPKVHRLRIHASYFIVAT